MPSGLANGKGKRGSSMKDVGAEMAKKAARGPAEKKIALHRCYGQIGISAVAAAARYQGTAKNSAYAPVAIKSHADSQDTAA